MSPIVTTDYFDEGIVSDLLYFPPSIQLEWRFDEGSGTAVVDHSGNGYNGTLGGGLGAPYYPTWGAAGLSFNGHKQVGIPLAAIEGAAEVLCCCSPATGAGFNQGSFLSMTAIDGPLDLGFSGGDARPGLYTQLAYSDSGFSSGVPYLGSAVNVSLTQDGSVYLDAAAEPWLAPYAHGYPPPPRWTTVTQGMVGAHSFSNYSGFAGWMHFLVLYGVKLTPAQRLHEVQRVSNIVAARGVTVAHNPASNLPLIAFAGDSQTRYYLAATSSVGYGQAAVGSLTRSYGYANYAVSGDGSSEMITYLPLLNRLLGLYSGKRCLVYMIGTNQNWGGSLLTDTAGFYTALKAAGWDDVIAVTGLPRYALDTPRTSYNTTLRAGVGVYCDAVADWGGDPVAGAPGAYSDVTLYPDHLHPSTSNHNIGKGDLVGALNARGYA